MKNTKNGLILAAILVITSGYAPLSFAQTETTGQNTQTTTTTTAQGNTQNAAPADTNTTTGATTTENTAAATNNSDVNHSQVARTDTTTDRAMSPGVMALIALAVIGAIAYAVTYSRRKNQGQVQSTQTRV